MDNKRRRLTKLFIVTLLTSLVYIITPTLKVHADYDGGQTDGNSRPSQTVVNGPTADKTCLGIYLAESDCGEPASKMILIANDGYPLYKDDNNYKLNSKDKLFTTPVVKGYSINAKGEMKHPVIWNGSGWDSNGYAVREWLTSTKKYGIPLWQKFAEACWSQDPCELPDGLGMSVYDYVMENPDQYVLVVVPIAWMNAYVDNKNTGKELIATADGWAAFYDERGKEQGDSLTNRMTHQDLPCSMTPKGDWFSGKLKGHDGERKKKLKNDDIRSSGWGMHIITLNGTYEMSFFM